MKKVRWLISVGVGVGLSISAADLKVSQLPATNRLADADLLLGTGVSPAGSWKITKGNFLSNSTFYGLVSITNLAQFTNANTLHVRIDGNNATAIRGRFDKPWASPSNAVAVAQSGDTVLIWPGTYDLAARFYATGGLAGVNANFTTNLTIQGFGRSTVLNFTNQGDCVILKSNENLTLRDLDVRSIRLTNITQLSPQLFASVRVHVTHNSLIENVHVINHSDHGIAYISEAGIPQSTNIMVRRCVVRNVGSWNGTRYDGTAFIPASFWTVQDCESHDNARGWEPFDNFALVQQCTLVNSLFRNTIDSALLDGGSPGGYEGIYVRGNRIENVAGYTRDGSNSFGHGIALGGNSFATRNLLIENNVLLLIPSIVDARGIRCERADGLRIIGNTIIGALSGIEIVTPSGQPNGFRDVMIAGNKLDQISGNGMAVSGTNVTIWNNEISNIGGASGGSGLWVRSHNNNVTTNFLVANNIFRNDPGFTNMVNGIYTDAGILSMRLAHNLIYGQSGPAIVNNSAANTLYTDFARTRAVGTLSLSSGLGTVSSSMVRTGGLFFLTPVATANAVAAVGVTNIVAGTSFQIRSTSATDANRVDWQMLEP